MVIMRLPGSRSSPWAPGALCAILFLLIGSRAGAGPGPKGLQSALADLEVAESLVADGRQEAATLRAQVRDFPVERRVLDADLFFELGEYGKAAVLYRDLAANPQYRGHPGWARATFLLGESLYRLGAMSRALQSFRVAAASVSEPYRSRSMARVFEIAAREARSEGIEGLESTARDPGAPPEVRYAYGKWLRVVGRGAEASTVLGSIPEGSEFFGRAQYLLGVMAAARGDLLEAFGRFAASAAAPVRSEEDALVRGAAVLAQGRVLCSQDRVAECMSVLQGLDARSAAFPEAIFELAWAHYKAGDLPGAARSLDVLLMTAPEGDLALKARALRGRVLVRMQDRAGAEETWQQLTQELAPVSEDLERLLSEGRDLEAWLDYLADRGGVRRERVSPLAERTEKWLLEDPDLRDLVGLLDDLREQRAEIQAGMEIARSLSWALRSGARMEVFPALKARYLQDREAEGRALRALRAVLSEVRQTLIPRLSPAVRSRWEGGQGQRTGLQEAVDRLPVTREDFLARERAISGEAAALGQEVFLIQSLLQVQRAQLQAIQEWIRERKASAGDLWTPEREAFVRREIARHQADLARMEQELVVVRRELEQQSLSANAPESLEAEDRLRRQAIREGLDQVRRLRDLEGVSPADGALVDQVLQVADRVERVVAAVSEIDGVLLRTVAQGTEDLEGEVTRATRQLESAAGALQGVEMETLSTARFEVRRAVRGVRSRLGVALLEADLGRVELAWEAAMAVERQQEALGRAHAEQVRGLEAVEKALRKLRPGEESSAGGQGRPAK